MQNNNMESEIQEKGLTFPRITPEHIANLMSKLTYHQVVPEGTTTTITTAFTKIGDCEFSLGTSIMACVDKRNYNAELGFKYGKEKAESIAEDKLWELEGYFLAKELALQALIK